MPSYNYSHQLINSWPDRDSKYFRRLKVIEEFNRDISHCHIKTMSTYFILGVSLAILVAGKIISLIL